MGAIPSLSAKFNIKNRQKTANQAITDFVFGSKPCIIHQIARKTHNLNIDGGNDKICYFFNFGYLKQDGVYKTGDLNYDKYNFRSNVTANITKGLKAQILTSARMDQKNTPNVQEYTVYKYTWNQIPTNEIYANNNPLYPAVMRDNMNPAVFTDASKIGSVTNMNKNLTSQLNLTYDIPGIPGLTAKALFILTMPLIMFYIPNLVKSPSGITLASHH